MDVPTADLVVGLVGAFVLLGLIAGLVVVDNEIGSAQVEGADAADGAAGNGTSMQKVNDTFQSSMDPGATIAGDESQQQEREHAFDVPNGTTEIRVDFSFTGDGDLDCHLYDPNGTKHGDEHCHQGTPDDPQGGNFTLEGDVVMPGEWRLVVHTGESGEANLHGSMDYTAEVVRVVQA